MTSCAELDRPVESRLTSGCSALPFGGREVERMDPHLFWTSRRLWPAAIPGHLFIAEAVHSLGRARFPKSWTGREPWGKTPLPLPRRQEWAGSRDVARAYRLLGRSPLQIPAVQPPGAEPLFAPMDQPSWRLAVEKSLEEGAEASKAQLRWLDVLDITTRLFVMKGLHLYCRRYRGGGLEGPYEPNIWQTEEHRLMPRYGLGMIDFSRDVFSQVEFGPTQDAADPRFETQDFRYMYVPQWQVEAILPLVSKMEKPLFAWADEDENQLRGRLPSPAPEASLDSSSGTTVVVPPPPVEEMQAAIEKRGRGRPKGATNWDPTEYLAEYERRLRRYGRPSKQNVDGWTTREIAAETVLDVFYEGMDGDKDPPSISTAKGWGRQALKSWEDKGSPRNN